MDIETVAKVGAIFATGFSVGVGATYHWASLVLMNSCRSAIAERERVSKTRANMTRPEARPEPPPAPPAPPAPAVTEYRLPTKIGSVTTFIGRDVYVSSTEVREERCKGSHRLNDFTYTMRGRVMKEADTKGCN